MVDFELFFRFLIVTILLIPCLATIDLVNAEPRKNKIKVNDDDENNSSSEKFLKKYKPSLRNSEYDNDVKSKSFSKYNSADKKTQKNLKKHNKWNEYTSSEDEEVGNGKYDINEEKTKYKKVNNGKKFKEINDKTVTKYKNKRDDHYSSDEDESYRKKYKNYKNKRNQLTKRSIEESDEENTVEDEDADDIENSNINEGTCSNDICADDDSDNDDDEEENLDVPRKKVKYSIKFAHEKSKNRKEKQDNILRIHRDLKQGKKGKKRLLKILFTYFKNTNV